MLAIAVRLESPQKLSGIWVTYQTSFRIQRLLFQNFEKYITVVMNTVFGIFCIFARPPYLVAGKRCVCGKCLEHVLPLDFAKGVFFGEFGFF